MALSVLVVLLLAVLYESIKVGKAKLLYQATVGMSIPTSQLTEETDQDSSSSDSPPVVIGYFMMLAVMSYNTWIFFGVILGSAVGYYLAYPLLSMV
ncbi:hypothetical protein GH733_011313 [Mirounga leonina]|nr:hypothetical protein GH733_011313 [Mirounga leonina]